MKSEMARTAPNSRVALWISIFVTVLAWFGCSTMSESIKEPSVGLNGGFENSQSGLPVNWLVYSPSTIPTGNYELSFDKVDFKEGRQSLKFLVQECSSTGGWHSPGITQQYPAKPGESYWISFWIKNAGCDYTVKVGGVDAKTGQYQTVDSSKNNTDKWKFVEYEFIVPRQYDRIRFELSICSPGSLWIDDITIVQSNSESR